MNVSNELFEIIEYGQKLSEETDGAFDLTVGAASRLWRIAYLGKDFLRGKFIQCTQSNSIHSFVFG